MASDSKMRVWPSGVSKAGDLAQGEFGEEFGGFVGFAHFEGGHVDFEVVEVGYCMGLVLLVGGIE